MSKSLVLFTSLLFACISGIYSQGVTTSSMKGKVVTTDEEPIFAATVVAVHIPTGTQYGTITRDDGRFSIRNMRVGGPFIVRVTYIGYEEYTESDIFLQLNKTADISVTLKESIVALEEVAILYNKNDVINSDRTGSMTNVSREEIRALPTIKRSQQDLTRLTPESDGNSFGGRNNLYNNFSLDGSIFNNPFGLDYAVPGGQTDAQPVSLDAIDQIQVSLAPFDVKEGGFTGAGVNAVTKSGTNEIRGTAYYFFRNENMIGKKIGNVEVPNLDFATNLFGATIGGPIVRNRLFFFLSAEGERRNELAHGWIAQNSSNASQENVTSVMESDIEAVQGYFRTRWGYNPGDYQGYYHRTFNNKLLAKLNWNITNNHNAVFRYNMLDSWKDILPHPEAIGGRGPTSFRLPFANSSYRIYNSIHSLVGEVNSIFSSKVSNKLMIGYTVFRDSRIPHSAPFPAIDIYDANNRISIMAGSEMFSTHNRLYQDVFQFTDNATIYMEKHTFTAGINLEIFKFENSFNLFYYPNHGFQSVNDFLNDNAYNQFVGNYSPDFNQDVINSLQNPYNWSYVNVGQLALYLQDEFAVSDKLNLTFGFRMDIPFYLNEIEQTDAVKVVMDYDGWVTESGESIAVDPSSWPKSVPLWSPRFGFNYDVKGDKTLQLRGGTGIFSGRIPFVWLGNQSSNPGIAATDPADFTFQVNATDEKFHWPQVWKTNLAVDAKAGKGWIFTLEGIYGKDINAIVHRNYNMRAATGILAGTGDNRQMFASFPEVNIYSADPNTVGFLDAGTIVLNNTREGYQASITGKVIKRWESGLSANLAYTYLSSKDYTSIPAEIAADAFQRSPVTGSPNFPQFSWSRYGLNHRIVGSLFYSKSYNFMASTIGLFFEVGQANRYSYVYAGDLNLDNIPNNDLIYVPASSDDINFGEVENGVAVPATDAAAQWQAFDAFIGQDPYLKDRRGQYADRNGASLPWFSQLDLRYMHDFVLDRNNKKHAFQVSIDILNLGNMLSSKWGVRRLPRTTEPISVRGVDNNNVPWFKFDTDLKESFVDDFSVASKWQLQVGIRYLFN